MKNRWLFLAAVSGFFCIAFGAFAAHGLQKMLDPKSLAWIDTGLKYQMFHTLALFGLGLFQIANQGQHLPACRAKACGIIGGSWTLGILFFSGSLYALGFGLKLSGGLAWITPLGAVCFLLGWGVLIYLNMRRGNNVE